MTLCLVYCGNHMFLSNLLSSITFPSINEITNLKILNWQTYSKIMTDLSGFWKALISGCCIIRRKKTHAPRGDNAKFSQRGQQLEKQKQNGMETNVTCFQISLSEYTRVHLWLQGLLKASEKHLFFWPVSQATHPINVRVPTILCSLSPPTHCMQVTASVPQPWHSLQDLV